ncbi:hypothetical protein EDD17DRAFT_1512986 [Pisolithus thermaeus]|nr:hypothetical protein EDD17DRAFT_1512986 [Pisolithus thermaeus]
MQLIVISSSTIRTLGDPRVPPWGQAIWLQQKGGNPVYGGQWAVNSEKFQLSVMNCLISLKDKYCEHVKSLNQMGVGVSPGASNLHETIISMFPHFKDLNLIWRGNPSFNAWPFTSDQQMNCSEDMLSLVQGGATCPSDDLFTTNSGEPAAPQDNSATSDQGIGGTPWGEYDYGGMGDYDYSGMGEHDGQYLISLMLGMAAYGYTVAVFS